MVVVSGNGFKDSETYATGSCTVTANSLSSIATAASSAAAGSTICVSEGTYDGELILSAHPSADITIQPVPGDTVTLTNSDTGVGIAVDFAGNAKHIVLRNFYITSEVNIEAGASDITIDHNDITGGYFGIAGGSVNCEAPNAPVYPGCTTTPVISNITISGNRLHDFGYASTNNSGVDWPVDHQTPAPANSEDALHFNNFDGLHITANEITGVEEGGNHSDCLQTVWGGSNLTFDHNYEHDNQCQGFFLKDGDVSNVSVTNNLFLRDYSETYDQADLQVFNTTPLTIRNNTFWELQGNVIRTADSSFNPPTAAVDHNVFMLFNTINDSGPAYQLTEDYDIFRSDPYSFFKGANSTISSNPGFANTATDNYQLASNPNNIGVDWQPSDYTYGPLPTSPDSGGSGPGSSGGSSSSSGSSVSSTSTQGNVSVAQSANKLKPATYSPPAAAGATKPAKATGGLTISDLQVTDIGQRTATISWHTDRPASSGLRYGQGSNLNMNSDAPGDKTDHTVTLDTDFLKPGLQYSAQAVSVDGEGKEARSQIVSFRTDGLALLLTVTDSSGEPLPGATVTIAGNTQITDGQGKAEFIDLPYGNYTATITYKGRTINAAVKITGDFSNGRYGPQTLNLKLSAVHKSSGLIYKIVAAVAVLVILAGGSGFFLRWRPRKIDPPPSGF